MSEPGNPASRFAGLAGIYAKSRPGYPAAALDFIMTRCGLDRSSLLVDIGCGTGISSRLFSVRGVQVIGVEPNGDMRARAEAESQQASEPKPIYRAGRAEATGLRDATADAVLAAQAFHWFDKPAALREFHRILKPGGWAVLMWNERDQNDPFTAAYGEALRTLPETDEVEGARSRAGDALLISPLFRDTQRVLFANEQVLDEEGLLGRAFSASYAPRQADQAAVFAAKLKAVYASYQEQGHVVLRYQTSVYLGRRGELPSSAQSANADG